jgi:hypothetical protein
MNSDVLYLICLNIDDISTLENFLGTNKLLRNVCKTLEMEKHRFLLYAKKLFELFEILDFQILRVKLLELDYSIKINIRILYNNFYNAFQYYFLENAVFYMTRFRIDFINCMFTQPLNIILSHCKIIYSTKEIIFEDSSYFLIPRKINFGLLETFHSNFCQIIKQQLKNEN